jgi:hypothetical protein
MVLKPLPCAGSLCHSTATLILTFTGIWMERNGRLLRLLQILIRQTGSQRKRQLIHLSRCLNEYNLAPEFTSGIG